MSEITRYCSCGAQFSVGGNLANTDRLLQLWEWEHSVEGHKRCSATEASSRRETLDREQPQVCPKCDSKLANMYCIACGWSLHKC